MRFVEEMHPGRVVYNAPSAHRFKGALDVHAFDRAFALMVQRQPGLRTSIVPRLGGRLRAACPRRCRGHAAAAHRPEPAGAFRTRGTARRNAACDGRRDLRLDRAPLFKARLFKLADDEHAMFFMTHHIVWDGWSFDVLYAEMSELYEALRSGREPGLPPLALTYGDYAEWHTELAEERGVARTGRAVEEAVRAGRGAGAGAHRLPARVGDWRARRDVLDGCGKRPARVGALPRQAGRDDDEHRDARRVHGHDGAMAARAGALDRHAGSWTGDARARRHHGLLQQHAADQGACRTGEQLPAVDRFGAPDRGRRLRESGRPVRAARRGSGSKSQRRAGQAVPGDVLVPGCARPSVAVGQPRAFPHRVAAPWCQRGPEPLDDRDGRGHRSRPAIRCRPVPALHGRSAVQALPGAARCDDRRSRAADAGAACRRASRAATARGLGSRRWHAVRFRRSRRDIRAREFRARQDGAEDRRQDRVAEGSASADRRIRGAAGGRRCAHRRRSARPVGRRRIRSRCGARFVATRPCRRGRALWRGGGNRGYGGGRDRACRRGRTGHGAVLDPGRCRGLVARRCADPARPGRGSTDAFEPGRGARGARQDAAR